METETVLLNEEQTAELLGLKPSTLQRWRTGGFTDLPYIRIRYFIRYQLTDVLDFLERNRVGSKAPERVPEREAEGLQAK